MNPHSHLSTGLLRASLDCGRGVRAHAGLAADDGYKTSVEKWRRAYETALRADDGWLTVAGLFWLHEGENRFGSDPLNDIVLNEPGVPAEVGSFDMHDGKISVRIDAGVQIRLKGQTVQSAQILPDSDDRLVLGDLSLLVHRSGERYAVRLKDKNSKYRREFAGLRWFPIDESYRATAKFVAYDSPRDVTIQNEAGDTLKIPSPGYAAFLSWLAKSTACRLWTRGMACFRSSFAI